MSNARQVSSANPSFAPCEQGVRQICEGLPDSTYQEVILTRLYYHVQAYLNDFFNASLRDSGMNINSWTALMLLYTCPDNALFPSDLSSALAFSRTNATRVVDDLVEHGWIERQPCADDRRKTRLALTDAGIAYVQSALPKRHQLMCELWVDFSDVEKTAMEALLRKLLARLGG